MMKKGTPVTEGENHSLKICPLKNSIVYVNSGANVIIHLARKPCYCISGVHIYIYTHCWAIHCANILYNKIYFPSGLVLSKTTLVPWKTNLGALLSLSPYFLRINMNPFILLSAHVSHIFHCRAVSPVILWGIGCENALMKVVTSELWTALQ